MKQGVILRDFTGNGRVGSRKIHYIGVFWEKSKKKADLGKKRPILGLKWPN